jgi:hypothetical protein
MNKKQTINWLVGTVLVGVLMVGLSTTVSASLLDNRYHISGYVGSNKTNGQDFLKNRYYDVTHSSRYGLDLGMRLGDSPFAISLGYFSSYKSDRSPDQNTDYALNFIEHRFGGRWIHDYSDRLSVYLGAGVSQYNLRMCNKLTDSTEIVNINQQGLYSEVAGIVSITDRLYTGAKIDYSFSNSTGLELSAISYGVVAGVSF